MANSIAIIILALALIILAIAFSRTSKYFITRIDQLEEEIMDFYYWRDRLEHEFGQLKVKCTASEILKEGKKNGKH